MVIGRDDVTLMVGYRYTVQVNAITLYKFKWTWISPPRASIRSQDATFQRGVLKFL